MVSWHRSAAVAAGAAAFVMATLAPPVNAVDIARGRDLYEQRCGLCHAQSVHSRAKRKAREFTDVREWVERWSTYLELNWGPEEVEDVTMFLNAVYYGFAIPANGGYQGGNNNVRIRGDRPQARQE